MIENNRKLYAVLLDVRVIAFIGTYAECIILFVMIPFNERFAVFPIEAMRKNVFVWKTVDVPALLPDAAGRV